MWDLYFTAEINKKTSENEQKNVVYYSKLVDMPKLVDSLCPILGMLVDPIVNNLLSNVSVAY